MNSKVEVIEMTDGAESRGRIYHEPWPAFKRDVRRAIGIEKYEIGWAKTGPKSLVGRFAKAEEPIPCEQCGRDEIYFHCVGDHVSYPFGIKRNSLICHSCHIENRGENLVSGIDPRQVFADDE